MDSLNGAGQDFVTEPRHLISDMTENPRETSILFQRISVALQRSAPAGGARARGAYAWGAYAPKPSRESSKR
jgi:hypothetical protein